MVLYYVAITMYYMCLLYDIYGNTDNLIRPTIQTTAHDAVQRCNFPAHIVTAILDACKRRLAAEMPYNMPFG